MAINRHPRFTREITAPLSHKSLHDHYVRAVNAALEAGREREAHELAAAYAEDLAEPFMTRRAA